jgi:hypothetical protein
MTITLNVQNEQLFDKILHFLNRFTNDGLEIITNRTKKENRIEPVFTPKQKKLPSGFLNPIKIDSYSDIASRDEIYER